ncbi:MAG: hypothetical protein V4603_04395 [Pseudomonadota bacterium]
MTPYLIELQDSNIVIRSADEVLARSPGFANIAGPVPVFGEEARSQARLHPRHSFNHFWSQLSVDPLTTKNKYFRHTADLAYSHLHALTNNLAPDNGVVLAVPGSYTRTQLAVLLGVAKQCAFNTVGLVDLALLQVAGGAADDSVVIDLQLHQAVLTSFRKADGQLIKDRVVQIPFAGLLALQDGWLNMITDEFIRQSRFDPQRDAESEQYIVNQLASLLAASQHNNELVLEINLKGTVHQAHLTREQFEQKAQQIFARIGKEVAELRNPDSVLHVAASYVNLPGLTKALPGIVALDEAHTLTTCMHYLPQIQRAPESLQLISRLSLDKSSVPAPSASQTRIPTHVLYQSRALMLPLGRLTLGSAPAGLDSARLQPLQHAAFNGAIALLRSNRGLQLELHTVAPVLLNGQPANTGQALVMGDTLQLGNNGPQLQLIVVEQAA